MSWLAVSAAAVSPFAGVALWALVARHLTLAADAPGAPRAANALPVLGWAPRLRAGGGIARQAAWRGGVEVGAVVIALWALAVEPAGWVWPSCALVWLLLAAGAVDARERLLPDEINLAIGALGLLAAAPLGLREVAERAFGAGIGYLAFAVFAGLYAKLRHREGLGQGDAKLLAALGAWVSWQGLASVVTLAAGPALIVAVVATLAKGQRLRSDLALPLGPFLALGGWLTWLYGPIGFVGGL